MANAFFWLPEDTLIDIFLKLPVKSLARCKCVCKYFHRLLTSSYFIKLHISHAKQNNQRVLFTTPNSGNITTTTTTLHSLDYDNNTSNGAINYNHPLPRTLLIVGSCNGLVCLSDYKTCIQLCNPAINEHIEVPFGLVEELPTRYKRRTVLGFGHDPLTDIYKVVRVDISYSASANARIDAENCKVYVYTVASSSSHEWRRIQTPPNYCFSRKICSVAHVNGALHWFKRDDKLPSNNAFARYKDIISFDIGNEKFGTVGMGLISFPVWPSTHRLGVLQGYLSVCNVYYVNGFVKYFDIWMMKDYGVKESWTKQFSIPFRIQRNRLIAPMVCRRNGGILWKQCKDRYARKKHMYVYDPVSKKVDVHGDGIFDWISAATYVETLVSIPSSSEKNRPRITEAEE